MCMIFGEGVGMDMELLMVDYEKMDIWVDWKIGGMNIEKVKINGQVIWNEYVWMLDLGKWVKKVQNELWMKEMKQEKKV